MVIGRGVVEIHRDVDVGLLGLAPDRRAALRELAKDVVLHLAFRRSLRRAAQSPPGRGRPRSGCAARRRRRRRRPARHRSGVPRERARPAGRPAVRPAPRVGRSARQHRPRRCRRSRRASRPAPRARRSACATGSSAGSAELGVELEIAGWVSDERLRELYRGAVAFAHPTKYEAYAGLPVLEAMALGTPVVVLDAPGATEAVEGVGIVVPTGGSRTARGRVRPPARRPGAEGRPGRARARACREPDVGVRGGGLRGRVQEGARLPPRPRGT